MKKIFEQASFKKPQMSGFNLSHDKKLSLKFGKLYPVYLDEVLPSDDFSVNSEILMRMAPMVAPMMHEVNVYMHYFYVPNRIIWDQFEEFITGGKNGDSVITPPQFTLDNATKAALGTTSDYFGLPTGDYTTQPLDVNALPFRAYAEIWNEYYRDQNLTDPIDITSAFNYWELLDRCWEKDYFTSALPWSQRGPDVSVPIAGQFSPQYKAVDQLDPGTGGASRNLQNTFSGNMFDGVNNVSIENLEDPQSVDGVETLVTELRRSVRLQEFFEKAAKAGSRYKEQLLAYFGVRSSDSRLDRPEYLGGGMQPIRVSEVLNTSATASQPQGDMSGHGITVGGKNAFRRKFEEHGFVIGIMSVLPKTAYQQGVNRLWSRDDRFDYYFPDFAHIGEQEVLYKELYYNPAGNDTPDETFGYQQRYAEYKYKNSTVHGDFRDTLDFWHMSRKFDSQPALNENFVSADPTDRIFAVQDDTDYLWAHIYHSVKARRPMPFFADPRL
ncbi:major capsid protein [Microviridae sp.]|nr:major capsid protein [Microviridae sp.]